VEEALGDFLVLVASLKRRWLTDLSNYGLVTFGAIVEYNKPGILAHLPSTPSPEWYCRSLTPNVKAAFSTSGISAVSTPSSLD